MRRWLQVVAFVCTLMINAASMAAIVTQTVWFKEWLRGVVVRQADQYVNGHLTIGHLGGNLLFGVDLGDVAVTMGDRTVVALKNVSLDYSVLTFLQGHVVLDRIHLNKPTLYLERTATGWNLAELIKVRAPNTSKNRRPIEIGQLAITDGRLYVEGQPVSSAIEIPRIISGIDASLGIRSDANETRVDLAHVAFDATNPDVSVKDLSGVIRRSKDGITFDNLSLRTGESLIRAEGSIRTNDKSHPVIDLKASSDGVSMQEVSGIVPSLRGYERLRPAFDINAVGPADHLGVRLSADDERMGQLAARVVVDAVGPQRSVAGVVQTEHFNVGALVRGTTIETDVTARGTTDLELPSAGVPLRGTYSMRVSRAVVAGYQAHDVTAKGRVDGRVVSFDADGSGYGGHVTAIGTVRTDAPLTLDLTGTAQHVDLREAPKQLNLPDAPSNLQFHYRLSVRSRVLSGDLEMDKSTLADAAISPGTVGTFRLGDGAPEYSAKGHVENVDLRKIARGFDISALDDEKFQSRLNGTVDMKGKGGGRYPLTLEASGTAVDSEIFRASIPHVDFTTTFDLGDALIRGNGQFTGLDPAVVTGDRDVEGSVGGSGNVEVTLRGYADGVTPDSIDVSGHIDLGRSSIHGLEIEKGVIDGAYANRVADLNQLALEGRDIRVSAHGPLALNETGSSNLAVHAQVPSLERLAPIVGRSDIRGAVTIEGEVTGNARELNAKGTLHGMRVGRGQINALEVESTFDASIPHLTPVDATIHANGRATSLEIAGQKVDELAANATYSQSKLDFDATATQGDRELTAQGSALLHTDRSEVHINTLSLRTEQGAWQTDPGSHPTVQYSADRVAVDNVVLVNGDQRLEAEGAIGAPADVMRVRVRNVDLAPLDALVLGDQRFSGRLNADATVMGTRSMPRVSATFTLAPGAFRGFTFDSLGGRIESAGDQRLGIDVRLEKGQAWIAANGAAPLTLFRPNPAGVGRVHIVPGANEAVDIQVTSSPIDLGIVQGFTQYVTNVRGTMQANFKVGGSGYDPHLDGAIDIKGGSFTVPDLGMSYRGLDTHIDLKPEEVTISQFKILDDNLNPLTIGGSLAVHEHTVGAVDIEVKSDDFKVINNRTAQLKLDSDVRVTGTVGAPRVEGTLEVGSGVLDVADVLDFSTRRPYSTTPIALSSLDRGRLEPTTSLLGGLFDSIDLRLSLAIPGDLLLKGNAIRPGNASIDAGGVNVYVGGAVGIVKPPHEGIRVSGEVNTVRGSYTFQGRRFELMRDGRIRFQGGDVIDPLLELQARRVISGVETFVNLRGTMLQPELSFSSNPPLEESDILSLIIFNTPINELAVGQQASLATHAQELAGSYLSAGLSQSIGNILNLSEFEIQGPTLGGLGPSITVGEQVSKGLFVRLQQGFGSGDATQFTIEKQLTDYLRLQGTVSDVPNSTQLTPFRRVERGGIDLLFFFSY